jgi:WD40 repeat protein
MTTRVNKIEPDELDLLLNEAEHGVAGNLLRSANKEIAPRSEFAQELEARLVGDNLKKASRAQRVPQPQPDRVSFIERLKAPFGGQGIRRIRRMAPVAFGGVGVAAMVLLFVGIASMFNIRQQTNQVDQPPIPGNTRELVKSFELLHTLPLNLSIPGSRDIQMAWSPKDNTLVAQHSQGGTAWDGARGQVKMFYPLQEANSMALSPDGRWIALGTPGSIKLYDSKTGKGPSLVNPPSAPGTYSSAFMSMSWSPDSNYLATAAEEPFSSTSALDPAPPLSVQTYLTSKEGVIRIWDVATGLEARTIKVPGPNENHTGWVSKVAWAPVGNTLASISSGGVLRLWDASTGEMLHYLATNHMYDIAHVAWSPNGRTLAVVALGQVQLWDAEGGKILHALPETMTAMPTPIPTVVGTMSIPPTWSVSESDYFGANSLLWSPDGNTLITADGGHIRLWDPATGQVKLTIRDDGYWLALSPDGRVLASAGLGGVVLRDAASGEQLKTLPSQQARIIAWSAPGNMLALSTGVSTTDAQIAVWGVPSGPGPNETPGAVFSSQPVPTIVPVSLTPDGAPTVIAPSQTVPANVPRPTNPILAPSCGLIWSTVPSHSQGTLNSVAAISSSDVWAVGYTSDTPAKTLVQHWNGKDWSIIPSPNFGTEDNKLYGVATLSFDNVWAVGYYGNDHPSKTLVMHWDGNTWTSVASPNGGTSGNQLRSIAAIATDDIWAVGFYTVCSDSPCTPQTLIIHWNGKEWRTVPSPNPGWEAASEGASLSAVAAISSNDIWAVGRFTDKSQRDTGPHPVAKPLFLHWDGKAWSHFLGPDIEGYIANMTAIAAISSNDVWAVGVYSTGDPEFSYLSLHWDGSAWTENPNPRLTEGTEGGFASIAAASSGNIWAAGWDLPSSHWDGKEWRRIIGGRTDGLPRGITFGMTVVAPDDIWAVGGWGDNRQATQDNSAFITHYSNVPCLTPISTSPTPPAVPTVFSTPAAQDSLVCRTWSIVDSPNVDSINELTSVTAISANDVWAVGYHSIGSPAHVEGTLVPNIEAPLTMHWDGKNWRTVDVPNLELVDVDIRLTSVSGAASNDVWAVGYYVGSKGLNSSADSTTLPLKTALILHWNGQQWSKAMIFGGGSDPAQLNAVFALSRGDVWAVGHRGVDYDPYHPESPTRSETLIVHTDGQKWLQVNSPSPGPFFNKLYALSASSPDDVWAVGVQSDTMVRGGGGGLAPHPLALHWDSKTWSVTPIGNSPSLDDSFKVPQGVAASRNEVYIVGGGFGEGGSASVVTQWDGAKWAQVEVAVPEPPESVGPPQDQLSGITALSKDDVWAVGSYRRFSAKPVNNTSPLVMHWNGKAWSYVDAPDPSNTVGANGEVIENIRSNGLNAIAAAPNGGLWAVGSSSLTSPTGVVQTDSLIMRYSAGPCATPTPAP